MLSWNWWCIWGHKLILKLSLTMRYSKTWVLVLIWALYRLGTFNWLRISGWLWVRCWLGIGGLFEVSSWFWWSLRSQFWIAIVLFNFCSRPCFVFFCLWASFCLINCQSEGFFFYKKIVFSYFRYKPINVSYFIFNVFNFFFDFIVCCIIGFYSECFIINVCFAYFCI